MLLSIHSPVYTGILIQIWIQISCFTQIQIQTQTMHLSQSCGLQSGLE